MELKVVQLNILCKGPCNGGKKDSGACRLMPEVEGKTPADHKQP